MPMIARPVKKVARVTARIATLRCTKVALAYNSEDPLKPRAQQPLLLVHVVTRTDTASVCGAWAGVSLQAKSRHWAGGCFAMSGVASTAKATERAGPGYENSR